MGLDIALDIIDAEINRWDLELFEVLLSKILGRPQITNAVPSARDKQVATIGIPLFGLWVTL